MNIENFIGINNKQMNKTQRDLLRAVWSKKMPATYNVVQRYANQYKKYDNMTIREIDTVIYELESLYTREGMKK